MKQKEVAHLLGISQKAYSRLELQEKMPNQPLLEKIQAISPHIQSSYFEEADDKNDVAKNPFNEVSVVTSAIIEELSNDLNTVLKKKISAGGNLQVEITIIISNGII